MSTANTIPPIREIRESKGMSLRRLALVADVGVARLSQFERGLEGVSIPTLYRVAKALDMNELATQLEPYVRERAAA